MDSNLEVLTQDSDHVFFRAWRVLADGSKTSVLAMRPNGDTPTAASLKRMSHEFSLRDRLDRAWAVLPLELTWQDDRTTLLFEDSGGEPLERQLGTPFKLDHFLQLAIEIAATLGKLHQCGLVHKDLKPAHILVNAIAGTVRLRGFGLATSNPRERQPIAPPETIDGTLAYMAPEQTGHMNRSIDARSDLYSLGVVFYQMLTGVLPFSAAEPMEWVHCHIARSPTLPERHVDVPLQISRIVLKLLAKTAEERYQTAAGLEHDLRRCLIGPDAPFDIDPFPPGARDIPDKLLIPEKLYGRETDIRALLAAFDSMVSEGMPELILVSGYSGIGKSSVVNELHKVLVPLRGLFASGKFDEFKRNIPYATVAQAFQSLISQLLGKSDEEMQGWRDALQDAVGQHGQLMTALVPNLTAVIGEQPPPPEIPAQDQQTRFQMVLRHFVSVFARREHPLTLFLDDLQWLDAATLDLIEHLITHPDVRYLLIVGAYRDNEVGHGHPLTKRLARLRSVSQRVREIELAPLREPDVARLISDTLHLRPSTVAPLAALVFEKTAGNPFFSIQFLIALAEQGLLTFDANASSWRWDLASIRNQGFTDNVADLMATKLGRLPAATQSVLGELACLGGAVSAASLALAQAQPEAACHAALSVAVQSGMLLQANGAYTFLHDRIREAAYALIPEEARASTHLTIGRALSARASLDMLRENIFEIVNQFGRGASLITDQSEREHVAALELIAGNRAKASAAYDAAARYYATGRELLSDTAWDTCYQLVFDLELNGAESLYLKGDMAQAEARLANLAQRARNLVDAAAVACVRINLYTTLDQSDDAVRAGLEYLQRIEGNWPARPSADDVAKAYDVVWQQIARAPIESLLDLPLMQSAERSATMDVLTVLTSPALFTNLNLFRLIVGRMATLSFEHGNSHGSSLAYAWLGSILGSYFNDYHVGIRFGTLGLNLVEQRGLDRFRARVYLVFAVHVANWSRPLDVSIDFLRRSFDVAVTTGDLSYATYSCADVIANRIASGDALEEVEQEAERNLEFARKARFGLVVDVIHAQRALIRVLRGSTRDMHSFDDAEFSESVFEQRVKGQAQLALPACYYWIRRLQASVFAGDTPAAIRAIARIRPVLWTTQTQIEHAEYHFYGALAWAMRADSLARGRHAACLERLIAHHAQLENWAAHAPKTFVSRAMLAAAEIARIQGHELDALHRYEEAISLARIDGVIYIEALAHERASAFCTTCNLPSMANAHLRSARQCYLRWGAAGKARQLGEVNAQLLDESHLSRLTGTIQTPVEHLDLATVLKVSQDVSREMMPDRLIDVLLRTAMEHAGAGRGVLILTQGREQRIAAEVALDNGTLCVRRSDRPVTAAELPLTVVHTVARSQETLIVRDAMNEPALADDPYVQQKASRSMLCLPMINQGKLTGVLYLENNLVPDVFTPARISVLRFVASQAAVALDNARLYLDLAEREAKIRKLVDANLVGITFWKIEGSIVEANDAFLQIVGYSREDLHAGALSWKSLTSLEYRERMNNLWLWDLRATGQIGPYEKEYIRKDGSRVPVLVASAGTNDTSEEGISFVLDLTERRRGEEALRTMRMGLEHANRVATMGQLTASIAHEVKQPMTGILNNAYVALRWLDHEVPDLPKLRQTIERIVRDGRRASDVIDRTSALVNKITPAKAQLDINEVIRGVVQFIRAETIRQSVQVSLDLADRLPTVYGDRVQLQQLILNLSVNAIEAMSTVQDRARVLRIASRADEANTVHVVVQDTGPGIDPAQVESAFDAFYTTKASGMGMGLAICRSIVDAHRGRLWICTNTSNEPSVSRDFCGAAFCCTLPVHAHDDDLRSMPNADLTAPR
ncbi:ATP-binding sensor histidine kinase [Paraburkholderia sp. DHOC27]|uniref:trifunctional serine/threonine-protein kinase/ATP-binding protein/sensor histidine kinase n=1 Tax=Paraburkholderia sp. DHOC27 TaxID=2303330 RepID=UPI000E3E5437|nr:ATP-binding sensor histidine kinase [Paraburkholderia sp. DHOC27]RFU49197.1 GAF domain-containing protein [Paraburkholderia sp. DHOC27]